MSHSTRSITQPRKQGRGGFSRIDTQPEGWADRLNVRAPLLGQVIGGRYRLVLEIGAGAMGQVFVAENLAIGMQVAVKLLKPDLLANPDFCQRFQQEAQAVAAIEHANVARFLDLVVGDPTFMVMEYVKGETLAEVLRKQKRLEVERALAIAIRLCWGLEAAHKAGVVHRDLKPSNVILAADAEAGESPRIIDFGLAKLAQQSSSAKLTRAGQIIGTPEYMAPEQIENNAVDARTDVYALGCVLYEMISGRTPFAGFLDDVQVLYRHMREAPALLSSHVPDLPPALDKVVARALAKEPGQRFASMRELAEALQRVQQSMQRAAAESTALTAPVMPPPLPVAPVRGPGRTLALVALAVATCLGMIAGVGLDRWRAGARPPVSTHPDALLVLTTTPAGAQVTIDGHPQAETTPTAVRGLAPGAHHVVLRKDGVEVERDISIGDERVAMQLVLPPASRAIKIRTVPSGAQIFVNGRLMAASSPATLTFNNEDFFELRLEKTGFEPFEASLKPEDEGDELSYTLETERKPRGALMVESAMPAEVWVDDVFTGYETPTLPVRIATGEHMVELHEASGKRSKPQKIVVQPGETVRLSLSFDGAGVE